MLGNGNGFSEQQDEKLQKYSRFLETKHCEKNGNYIITRKIIFGNSNVVFISVKFLKFGYHLLNIHWLTNMNFAN